jgi:hypothetical protein
MQYSILTQIFVDVCLEMLVFRLLSFELPFYFNNACFNIRIAQRETANKLTFMNQGLISAPKFNQQRFFVMVFCFVSVCVVIVATSLQCAVAAATLLIAIALCLVFFKWGALPGFWSISSSLFGFSV